VGTEDMGMNIDYMQLEFIDIKLRKLIKLVESEFGARGVDTITSLFRMNDSGVHGQLPLRGTDISCHDDRLGQAVEDFVNSKVAYDPKRPQLRACLYHDSGGGKHIHLQVHPNTILAG